MTLVFGTLGMRHDISNLKLVHEGDGFKEMGQAKIKLTLLSLGV